MPATGRPNTDYERWLQHHSPDTEFQPNPQYGPRGSRSVKYPPFHTPKTDRPRNPFAEPQIQFSPTDKELGSSSSHREDSNSFTIVLLLPNGEKRWEDMMRLSYDCHEPCIVFFLSILQHTQST
ncbi:hypothetical protein BDV26DRAFT_268961 [Aspergillus bertholletiae]|uniref:Uncharacterized protein n=1 Tax=Aspergillus bertholletiae TaxID=1226010 RepID=A0A5N7AYN8_9EURO|nr:hypothetical protein BDV26DRAFT_268961 [Aspergillus bertholletiae]